MSKFFVFIVVVFLAGCKTMQPVIEKTVSTKIDTAFIEIENKEALLKLIECNKNFEAQWLCNDSLVNAMFWKDVKFDSLQSLPAKIVIKKIHTREVDTIYKGVILPAKEKIVKVEVTPWWAYAVLALMFMFMVCFIITLLLLYKKLK